jgi:GTP-binding protein
MFADRARIFVAAGSGGDGASSFRREAHVPRGGPDGGDGGRGGDVVLVSEAGMTTLIEFRRKRHFRAAHGGRGARRRAHGRSAPQIRMGVPPGTVVRGEDGEWIGELLEPGQELVVARGGRGGRGNTHFASATHQAPRHFEKGDPGQERWIELELKLIAAIGLVGPPNAGKSTLLAALTAATPRIGSYPFTTTSPNLGVIELDEERTAVIADVPGLIEGANEGHGLGHEFLRHLDRTRVLVGVVDGADERAAESWQAVAEELRLHDPKLLQRPLRLVVTKLDLPEVAARWPELRDSVGGAWGNPIGVSAHDGTGLDALRTELGRALDEADEQVALEPEPQEMLVHRFDPLDEGWQVAPEGEALRISGRRIETAANRTDFTNEESRDRFQRLLERLGIDAELRRLGAEGGTMVRIGQSELEWGDEE